MQNRRIGSAAGIDGLMTRVLAEYREMPGLKLTLAQASRLWAMDHTTCERLLQTLAEQRLLRRTQDGCFVRA